MAAHSEPDEPISSLLAGPAAKSLPGRAGSRSLAVYGPRSAHTAHVRISFLFLQPGAARGDCVVRSPVSDGSISIRRIIAELCMGTGLFLEGTKNAIRAQGARYDES